MNHSAGPSGNRPINNPESDSIQSDQENNHTQLFYSETLYIAKNDEDSDMESEKSVGFSEVNESMESDSRSDEIISEESEEDDDSINSFIFDTDAPPSLSSSSFSYSESPDWSIEGAIEDGTGIDRDRREECSPQMCSSEIEQLNRDEATQDISDK